MGGSVCVLRVNGKKKRFESLDALKIYLDGEMSSWSWLTNSSGSTSLMRDLYRFLYSKPIEDVRSRIPLELNEDFYEFELGKECLYIESSSYLGKVIARVRREYGDLVAGFTLYYISDNRVIQFSAGDSNSLRNMANLERERALGQYIAYSSTVDLTSFKINASRDASISLFEKFQEEYSSCLTTMKMSTDKVKADATEFGGLAVDLQKQQSRKLGRRLYWYNNLMRRAKTHANKSNLDAVADLEAAKSAYHDNVALDASVSYWSSRERYHKRAKGNAFKGVLLGMFVMFAVVSFYYGFGGISKQFHLGVSQNDSAMTSKSEVSESTEKKVVKENSSVSPLASAPPNMANFVVDMVGAVLLLTIFGTLIRLGLRQFNIHSQLEIDAAEKITLTKTYLALLGENKLKADEDRRLVLEGIFRPSNPSVAAAEAAFSTPIELVLKTIKPN
ncbi:hypothetical protein [Pseudomonas putida]|uniref:hypothetical protein n=1 Tax=Pseudomonas putida TaxID=303 RepID=UPI00125E87E1|nr:hypothetical protein [Pseudomonas putida]